MNLNFKKYILIIFYFQRLPLLAKLARQFLAAPASSASSERAFKEMKSILGDYTRNRLEPIRTAALIFMRSQYLNKL